MAVTWNTAIQNKKTSPEFALHISCHIYLLSPYCFANFHSAGRSYRANL